MNSLTDLELSKVLGGAAARECTPENPRGTPSPTYAGPATGDGKSLEQRVIENTDRAMAPWKLLNGVAGGARTAGALPRYQPPR